MYTDVMSHLKVEQEVIYSEDSCKEFNPNETEGRTGTGKSFGATTSTHS